MRGCYRPLLASIPCSRNLITVMPSCIYLDFFLCGGVACLLAACRCVDAGDGLGSADEGELAKQAGDEGLPRVQTLLCPGALRCNTTRYDKKEDTLTGIPFVLLYIPFIKQESAFLFAFSLFVLCRFFGAYRCR